jgi:hypothetical protein
VHTDGHKMNLHKQQHIQNRCIVQNSRSLFVLHPQQNFFFRNEKSCIDEVEMVVVIFSYSYKMPKKCIPLLFKQFPLLCTMLILLQKNVVAFYDF